MKRADYKDKETIVDILTGSFIDNKSVNYIIRQDAKRVERIRNLMDYSFEVCYMFGDVFLSDDRTCCALVILPDKKRTTLKSVWLDIKLVLTCTGLSNIRKAMEREVKIKKYHLKEPMYYLWFIGVTPGEQNKGTGSTLLTGVIKEGHSMHRSVCLETSTLKNIPWYEKFGLKIYNELDLGYQLFFLRKDK